MLLHGFWNVARALFPPDRLSLFSLTGGRASRCRPRTRLTEEHETNTRPAQGTGHRAQGRSNTPAATPRPMQLCALCVARAPWFVCAMPRAILTQQRGPSVRRLRLSSSAAPRTMECLPTDILSHPPPPTPHPQSPLPSPREQTILGAMCVCARACVSSRIIVWEDPRCITRSSPSPQTAQAHSAAVQRCCCRPGQAGDRRGHPAGSGHTVREGRGDRPRIDWTVSSRRTIEGGRVRVGRRSAADGPARPHPVPPSAEPRLPMCCWQRGGARQACMRCPFIRTIIPPRVRLTLPTHPQAQRTCRASK